MTSTNCICHWVVTGLPATFPTSLALLLLIDECSDQSTRILRSDGPFSDRRIPQPFSVLCRNLTEPTILAGFDFLPDRSPAAVVAVEMWEPAFCAGFQAPGEGRPSGWELPRFPPGRVISIAKPEDSAHFRQNLPSTTVRHRKPRFLETRVNCVLLQILVQSPFFKGQRLLHERLAWPDDACGVGCFMIKTAMGFAYLLILALLGFLALVGAVAMLVRLIRRLGSMSPDDLKCLEMARQSLKGCRKKRKDPAPLHESVLGSMSVKAILQHLPSPNTNLASREPKVP